MHESYLIIGGNGFLGNWVVDHLLERNEPKVAVFDLRAAPDKPGVTQYNGDLTKLEDIANAIRLCAASVVIHTASPLHGGDANLYWRVNVDGTKNVIKACVENNVKKLIYTSSAGVMHDGKSDLSNTDETTPFPKKFHDVYNETKAEAETLVLKANGLEGLLTCALRPAGIFGPGDRQFLPGLITVMKQGQSKYQIGNNCNLFDWTYVENAAYAHLQAADRLVANSEVAGEAFFITNGTPIPFWDACRYVWAQFNHFPPFFIKMPRPLGMALAFCSEWAAYLLGKEPGFTRFRVTFATTNRYFNIDKARKLLAYNPIVDLEEGLRRTCNYFIEEERRNEKNATA